MPNDPLAFQQKLPKISAWIDQTLSTHASLARPVASLEFTRLALFYPAELLSSAKVIAVPRVPTPPLRAMGLPEFSDFEQMDAAGITYRNTFFVRNANASDESLHFHELVHVVQWHYLGPDRFLMAYAFGHILSGGYRTNPLEMTAYDLQDRFDRNEAPFDAAAATRHALDAVIPDIFARAGITS